MPCGMYNKGTRARTSVHTAWASVLLFGTKGNTRASMSGTARLQSRFLFICNKSNKMENAENPIKSRQNCKN